MAKREFVQLAHRYRGNEHITEWLISEKLDGMRCIWDGGVTRGVPKFKVPWANTTKDDRYVSSPIATGLWSRYGNVIYAPDWFLDALPNVILDGELYDRGRPRQDLMSAVKKIVPDDRAWEGIKLHAFDSPPPSVIFAPGSYDVWQSGQKYRVTIKNTSLSWWAMHSELPWNASPTSVFKSVLARLREYKPTKAWQLLPQVELSPPYAVATHILHTKFNALKARRADFEGLMIRNPLARYECERSYNILKMKDIDDMEVTIVGYITGRKTELDSKLLGKMGAAIVRMSDGTEFELSGFTDAERRLVSVPHQPGKAEEWATNHPETKCPHWIQAVQFPRGTRITIQYRGLTKDGKPNEARYWRPRDDE